MDSNKLFAITDRTAEFDPADISANKVMGILAYIGPLVFIPMFACKDSKYAQFNAEAGIILFIAEAIFGTLTIIPYLGYLFWLLNIGVTVISILGIVACAQNKANDLPLVNQFKFIKLMK